MLLYIADGRKSLCSPPIETFFISEYANCSKFCSSLGFFSKSWYVLFWAFAPSLTEIVGPCGIAFWVSIKPVLFCGSTLTNMALLSLNQLIAFLILAFTTGSVSLLAVAFSMSNIQTSVPSLVVFKQATIFSFGD